MNARSHDVAISSRLQPFLRWSARAMIALGLTLLCLVAGVALQANLYQDDAKHSLDREIQTATRHETARLQPAAKDGDVLGRIDIPRLGMSIAVLQGTSSRVLRLGAGHIEGTPLPGGHGNTGIAGHRDTFFRDLKDIRPNDQIQLQTANGKFRYEVDWVKVVAPTDITVLAPTNEAVLTLVTCYPFYFLGSAPKRFVVRAYRY